MGKGFGVATKHYINMAQVTIHSSPFRTCDEEELCGCAFLLRTVFGIGRNMDHFFKLTIGIYITLLFGDLIADFTDNFRQIFTRGDHTPAAD